MGSVNRTKVIALVTVLCWAILSSSCHKKAAQTASSLSNDEVLIDVYLLNDVYEISPLEGGKVAGMARVAYLFKKAKQENPNTLVLHAGDFLNPSLYGNLRVDGNKVKGKQMIDVMNLAGIDLATFGNHEFDLKQNELQEAINRSTFDWISANCFMWLSDYYRPFEKQTGDNFTQIKPYKIYDFSGVKVGVFAETIPFNKASYVRYENVLENSKRMYNELKDKCDIVIALTHQDIADDLKLADEIPGLAMILGGHDHTNMYFKQGEVVVSKADANARTLYHHQFVYNKQTHQYNMKSELIPVDEKVPFDPETEQVVAHWEKILNEKIVAEGFNANEIIYKTDVPLDGRESSVRNGPTNLAQIFADAQWAACPDAKASIINSGSIRIDDQIIGNVTQIDILRCLPFGGGIVEADMSGKTLIKTLETGLENLGTGGYLQMSNIQYNAETEKWEIGGKPIDENKTYRIALTDFLVTGGEAGLGFLKEGSAEMLKVYKPDAQNKSDLRNDIRKAVIAYLKKK